MAPAASDLAADLVKELPALATRLRKYDEQNFELQLRYDHLEEEIARVRRSIAYKQTQQVRFAEQRTHKDVGKGFLKRQRSEDEPDMRTLRPRFESRADDDRVSQNLDLMMSSADSELSLGTKRKGRVFSDEEMDAATHMS